MADDRTRPTDDLAALRALGRGLRRDDLDLVGPPGDLWARIEAATAADADPAAPVGGAETDADLGAAAPPAAPPAADPVVVGTDAPAGTGADRPGGTVVDRSRWWLVAAAVAAVLAIASGVVVAATRSDPGSVVASATLDRLGDAGEGDAELIEVDGTYRLRVRTDGIDAGAGFLEVWVIDRDVSRMVSLGPARPDGTYDLPPGIDPAEFPVVDVSIEPLDGDPTHSGDSVLRGVLDL